VQSRCESRDVKRDRVVPRAGSQRHSRKSTNPASNGVLSHATGSSPGHRYRARLSLRHLLDASHPLPVLAANLPSWQVALGFCLVRPAASLPGHQATPRMALRPRSRHGPPVEGVLRRPEVFFLSPGSLPRRRICGARVSARGQGRRKQFHGVARPIPTPKTWETGLATRTGILIL
jgi:hypothetical protein